MLFFSTLAANELCKNKTLWNYFFPLILATQYHMIHSFLLFGFCCILTFANFFLVLLLALLLMMKNGGLLAWNTPQICLFFFCSSHSIDISTDGTHSWYTEIQCTLQKRWQCNIVSSISQEFSTWKATILYTNNATNYNTSGKCIGK